MKVEFHFHLIHSLLNWGNGGVSSLEGGNCIVGIGGTCTEHGPAEEQELFCARVNPSFLARSCRGVTVK